jgi:hypothetical protein
MLVPIEWLAASLDQAGRVELPIKVGGGDMAQGLRPGDHVQVLAAYTDGLRSGRAQVLLQSVEVVRVLEEPSGLAGSRESGVQVRVPADRTALVAAAIASARVFVVKASSLPSHAIPSTDGPSISGPDDLGRSPIPGRRDAPGGSP